MDPLEQKLAAMKLAAPSERLDQRIDETFRAARSAGQGTRKVGFFWWVGAMATAGVVAAALLLAPPRFRSSGLQPVVYRIEAPVGLRDMLLDSPANPVEPTSFQLRGTAH
jgi:hypothetical protein